MESVLLAVPSTAPGGLEAAASAHFGHCDMYTLVRLNDGKVAEVETLPNVPHEHGGCMAPVSLLAQRKVQVLLAGGMGQRPLAGFQQAGIKVYFSGGITKVENVVQAFADNKLVPFGMANVCCGGGNCPGHG